ncbi:uncharacterized protein LOC120384711 isoform X2 [Mauremys reevesii]|uniref:uncharacterized protein LOC120384711 isoform X2 n=1 Tax=Mauremys reevesii TaxID=260615 RepID=UPI00193F6D0A|nr:uncharacterized protein LOC120384711 isoform X2 [Mauremys reevesii]
MEQSIVARLGCIQCQLHVARARLRASHEQTQVELAAVQAELVAVLSEGWRKVPLGQIRAPGDQSIGDRLDHIQAEVQRQAELRAGWEEILVHVARLQARFAQLQASTAEAQLKALQAQGKNWPKDAREPAQAQAVSGPVLKQVYEQVAAAVHTILVLAMQDLERAKQAQRLPVLSQLTRAVHAQVEVALRGILAKAAQEVAAADRVELAEALCSQVEKAVQDVIVKAEQDWGRPRGAVPGGSEGRGGEAAL